MIYTNQLLGATEAATKSDVAGAVSSIAQAAGDIFSGFFKYRTEKVIAETDANRTAATTADTGAGMDKGTKNALLVGGGVAAAALVLFMAMK